MQELGDSQDYETEGKIKMSRTVFKFMDRGGGPNSHRWDLQCIETGTSTQNSLSKKEFIKYIKYNPLDKDKMTEQIKGFNEHMERVIDDHETWTVLKTESVVTHPLVLRRTKV